MTKLSAAKATASLTVEQARDQEVIAPLSYWSKDALSPSAPCGLALRIRAAASGLDSSDCYTGISNLERSLHADTHRVSEYALFAVGNTV